MDFFRAQDEARRKSRILVFLFAAAVAAVIAAVYAVVHVFMGPGFRGPADPGLLLRVASATTALIVAGSVWRTRGVRRGGHVLAGLLGGRPIQPDTDDAEERRLLNVVEEMAIAAGVPVPRVYLLDGESGINAFAAGNSPADAALAVTAGALSRLDRNELAGVVAHELAHILNGDMRLNTRLVGLLYGLLLPGVVGRALLAARVAGRAGKAAPALLAAGAALVAIGQLGIALGRVIQASVSRQREWLADAFAVQFTRDPRGLAGALRKIGGLSFGARVTHPHAPELGHLFVADGLAPPLLALTATHPPLADRIRRIDPSFDGTFGITRTPRRPRLVDEAGPDRASTAARAGAEPWGAELERLGAAAILASIGDPGAGHAERAARLLAGWPAPVRTALREEAGARAVVLALLLAPDPPVAARQLETAAAYDAAVAGRVRDLAPAVLALGPHAAVPLLELAVPALRRLTPADARRFRRAALEVIQARGAAGVLDLAVLRTLARRLAPATGRPGAAGGVHTFRTLREPLEVLLSAVARSGAPGEEEARAAFDAAARLLPRDLALRLVPAGVLDLAGVDASLSALEAAALPLRRRALEACIAALARDGRVLADEMALVQAAAEALDLPLPPVLLAAAAAGADGERPGDQR